MAKEQGRPTTAESGYDGGKIGFPTLTTWKVYMALGGEQVRRVDAESLHCGWHLGPLPEKVGKEAMEILGMR
jgi:hypothetical protein